MQLNEKLAYSVNNEIQFIPVEHILFCKSVKGYTHIMTLNGKNIFTPKTLKELDRILPENHFCRIHHSTIVNINHINGYNDNEIPIVELKDGSKHQVSKRKKTALFSKFTKL